MEQSLAWDQRLGTPGLIRIFVVSEVRCAREGREREGEERGREGGAVEIEGKKGLKGNGGREGRRP